MTPIFTHDFEFKIGDPENFITGEIEFNVDGEVSFKLDDTSIPLQKEVLEHFNTLTSLLQTIFYASGGIKKIEFTKKP